MTAAQFAQWIPLVLVLHCLLALAGCSQQRRDNSLPPSGVDLYLSAREGVDKLSSSKQPVLVEFSVPVGCFRCNEMKNQLDMLAKEQKDRLQVCRVNFNYERSLVAEWGIKVCPTYVVFEAGEELFRMSYPTTSDMLAAKLDILFGDDFTTTNQEY